MNLCNFLISGRSQLFLQLWNASPNISVQRVSQILQYRQNNIMEHLWLGKPLGICNFFSSFLKNRDNHACPVQKGVAHICQWPLDPLGLRSTSKDHHSFSKVHAGFLAWCCSALSDSASKTFLKRTNTDKLLRIIKSLLFITVDVASSGWRYNSKVLR